MEIWGICFLRRRRIQKIMEFGVRELFGQSGIRDAFIYVLAEFVR